MIRSNAVSPMVAPLFASAVFAISACHRTPAPAVTATLPPLPTQQISPPAVQVPSLANPNASPDAAHEPRIDIDTHGAEVDVRPILDFIATKAGVSLLYSPQVNRKVRLHLIDVPVSQALQVVLSTAGLTLEGAAGTEKPPVNNAVVFYQLPVNVDSLSVDAIMKRFGVSRTMAEIIVQTRSTKP